MTQNITHSLEQSDGIVNAYSWPTGMWNEGPVEYGLYYNETIDANEVRTALETTLDEHGEFGAYVSTNTVSPEYNDRVNEAMDERNTECWLLIASVVVHPGAHPLATYLTNHEAVTWFDITWDPHSDPGELAPSQLHTALETGEIPGHLSVFFETNDNSMYDEIVDEITDAVNDQLQSEYGRSTVSVSQGDSDGYAVTITTTT